MDVRIEEPVPALVREDSESKKPYLTSSFCFKHLKSGVRETLGRLYKKKKLTYFLKRKSLLRPYPVMTARVINGLNNQDLHADKGEAVTQKSALRL